MTPMNPCRKCGSADRYKSGACRPCVLKHNRKWREANPEKKRLAERRWVEANPEKVRQNQRRWATDNPEKMLNAGRKWRSANLDTARRRARDIQRIDRAVNPDKYKVKSRRWRNANLAQARSAVRRWQQANPDKVNIHTQRRRALKLKQLGHWPMPETEWLMTLRLYRYCYLCSKRLNSHYHIEHVIPLSRGGLHEPNNVRLACAPCNLSKHNLTADEFKSRNAA